MKKSEFLKSWIKPTVFRPIHLEDKQISFIEINEKRNTVRCVSRNNHDNEPFTVRTSAPLHEGQCAGYFEVRIVNLTSEKYTIGQPRNVGVGLCRKDCSMKRPPGTSRWSVGIQPNGVVSYDKQRLGIAFKFGKDDIVGCGVIYDTQEVFFTKNGAHQPKTMFKLPDSLGEYFPNASLHCESEELEFNFGQKPFKFDFEAFLNKLRGQRMQAVNEVHKVDVADTYKLVEEYLFFSGYMETLQKFKAITGGNKQVDNYLLADTTGKDVLALDAVEDGTSALNVEEEEHKSEHEDNNDILGEVEEIKTPVAKRQRIMSESCNLDSLLLLSARKDSYDDRVMKLMGRKDSAISEIDPSVRMEAEEDQKAIEADSKRQLYGPLTRNFLENQRFEILNMLKQMRVGDALQMINKEIPRLQQFSPLLLYYLHGHIYLRLIKQNRIYQAIDFARQNKLDSYRRELFPKYCPERGEAVRVKFQELISAIALRKNYEKTLLSRQQFHSLAEWVNCEIMRCLGLIDKSKLQLMLTHIRCIEDRYDKERLNGDRIQLFG